MAWTITPGTVATGTDTSAETNAPSGVTAGDLLVLTVLVEGAVTITTPSNWTARPTVADGFGGHRLAVFERIATGGGDDTPTVTVGAGIGNWQTCILRIEGQKASSPFDTSNTASATSGTSAALPSITTAEDAELLIGVVGTTAGDVTVHPSGWDIQLESEPAASTLVIWTNEAGAAGSYGGDAVTVEFGASVRAILAYKAEPVNTPPSITSNGGGASATIHHAEGTTEVTTVTANGIPAPTFSITGGADSADFAINSSSGALTFSPAPTYLSPADANTDSVYVVEVTATNSEGTDSQTLTVVVYPTSQYETPAAPLDTVKYLMVPVDEHIAGNTQYPNFGTRTDSPFVLGDTYAASSRDPEWDSDGDGPHLVMSKTDGSWFHAEISEADVDSDDYTVAVLVVRSAQAEIGTIFHVMKDVGTDEKVMFLDFTTDASGFVHYREWDEDDAQVDVVSTTTFGTGDKALIVVTSSATSLKLYIKKNSGSLTLEDTQAKTKARRKLERDGYLEMPVGFEITGPGFLNMNGTYKAFMFDNTEFDSTEAGALDDDTFFMNGIPPGSGDGGWRSGLTLLGVG